MKRHLVLMAKAPRMGRVKTRLAADIGTVRAWAFHRRQMMETARKLKSAQWQCWLAVTPDESIAEGYWPQGWRRIPQGPDDLGMRMLRPMQTLPPGPVVVIGADIPGITQAMIQDAFDKLGAADFVFGPATDGGYWLVGAKRRPRLIDIFRGPRWSTEHALQDTLANVPKGIRVAFVQELADVDEAADL